MAEWKKLSQEEIEKINKSDVVVAPKAENAEVEGQGVCRCPICGVLLNVQGIPPYVTCGVCLSTFAVEWY